MAGMTWHTILSAAKSLGTAAVIVGVIAIVSFGGASKTKRQIDEYKKSGRVADLLKIFLRY
jgi:hypothetical protein